MIQSVQRYNRGNERLGNTGFLTNPLAMAVLGTTGVAVAGLAQTSGALDSFANLFSKYHTPSAQNILRLTSLMTT